MSIFRKAFQQLSIHSEFYLHIQNNEPNFASSERILYFWIFLLNHN